MKVVGDLSFLSVLSRVVSQRSVASDVCRRGSVSCVHEGLKGGRLRVRGLV